MILPAPALFREDPLFQGFHARSLDQKWSRIRVGKGIIQCVDDLLFALGGFRGKQQSGCDTDLLGDRPNHFCQVVLAELVDLGEDRQISETLFLNPSAHFQIKIAGQMADIEDMDDSAQRLGDLEEVGNHLMHSVTRDFGGLGETVSRKIDQVERLVDEVIIEGQGLSRRGAGFGQFTTSDQSVDHRGFSDVRTADHGEYRLPVLRHAVPPNRTGGEGGSGNFHRHCRSTFPVRVSFLMAGGMSISTRPFRFFFFSDSKEEPSLRGVVFGSPTRASLSTSSAPLT